MGLFKHSLHFVVSLPSADLLTEFLTTTLEKLLKQVPCTCRFCPSRCLLAVVLSVPSSGHRLWAFVWVLLGRLACPSGPSLRGALNLT